MDLTQSISKQLNISPHQVSTTIKLLDEGNTVPFISRYRKEKTGSLDEEQIRFISEWTSKLRSLEDRRQTILASITEQGKLTPTLEKELLDAETMTALEDLYAPYKPKRRTRASIAKELGLEPLAEQIVAQPIKSLPAEQLARPFLNDQLMSIEDVLSGARDIVAEQISDHARIRQEVRQKGFEWGTLRSEKIPKAEDNKEVFQNYYEFEFRVNRLRPHQTLAINRGEAEKVLRVKVEIAERDWLNAVHRHFRPDPRSPFAQQLQLAIEDSASRLLLPAIARGIRSELKELAEKHAIQVFAVNLRALLSQPPLTGHVLLGIDPGYRTGCKLAVVDPTGQVLDTGTIYPFNSQQSKLNAAQTLKDLVTQHQVSLVSIGNGTASRETEQLVAELIQSKTIAVQYLIVNEAGASVYSASPLARAELPEMDVSLRGAVSIARRVQDPLAELVKIDPKSIGVGLYQHDLDQKRLSESLFNVVESVVNQVGVDLSTASPSLLTYVAGIGPKLAEKIVAYRDEHGAFRNRAALTNVPGLGVKAFQ
ncbi:MAG: Tex-like N-terminal domain-containing protein, partial [Anaerolineales bacterium]